MPAHRLRFHSIRRFVWLLRTEVGSEAQNGRFAFFELNHYRSNVLFLQVVT